MYPTRLDVECFSEPDPNPLPEAGYPTQARLFLCKPEPIPTPDPNFEFVFHGTSNVTHVNTNFTSDAVSTGKTSLKKLRIGSDWKEKKVLLWKSENSLLIIAMLLCNPLTLDFVNDPFTKTLLQYAKKAFRTRSKPSVGFCVLLNWPDSRVLANVWYPRVCKSNSDAERSPTETNVHAHQIP